MDAEVVEEQRRVDPAAAGIGAAGKRVEGNLHGS
jgi:hypothetical protein